MENTYDLVIFHYDTGIVEYVTVPEEYKNSIEEYIFDVMDLLESNIQWMYVENGVETVYHD